MTVTPIKLLVINSSSASGSTLLDALMGSQPGVFTLGEIGVLGDYIANNKICACGQKFSLCQLWSSLPKSLLDATRQNEMNKYIEDSGFWRRWLNYWYGLFFQKNYTNLRAIKYGRNFREIFEKINDEQMKKVGLPVVWFIDATKSHWHLNWLYCSGLFDISAIHLVKDPRAYVYSMDKVYKDMKSDHPKATRSAFRLTYRWLTANIAILITHRMCLPKEKRRILQYTQLADDYEKTINEICDWLNTPFDVNRLLNFREQSSHAVGGNRMRTESRSVEVDEDWRLQLGYFRSFHVWVVAWPLARLFGFRR